MPFICRTGGVCCTCVWILMNERRLDHRRQHWIAGKAVSTRLETLSVSDRFIRVANYSIHGPSSDAAGSHEDCVASELSAKAARYKFHSAGAPVAQQQNTPLQGHDRFKCRCQTTGSQVGAGGEGICSVKMRLCCPRSDERAPKMVQPAAAVPRTWMLRARAWLARLFHDSANHSSFQIPLPCLCRLCWPAIFR